MPINAQHNPPPLITAYIGLGGNLEDPAAHILRACDELAATPGIAVRARSSLYRSAPIGYAEQPNFVNAVVAVSTTLRPLGLFGVLTAIEARHGRRRAFRNAPRTLDLDLLIFGEETSTDAHLTLPHPRAHLRAFVLEPLLEIAPRCTIPGQGTARALLAALPERCLGTIAQVAASIRRPDRAGFSESR